MTDGEIFSENLNALLEAKGMNASKLTKMLDSSYNTIKSYTRGKIPNTQMLRKLALVLGVPMDDFFREHRFSTEQALDALDESVFNLPELRGIPQTLRLLSIRTAESMDVLEQLFYGVICKQEDRRAAKADYLRHCRRSAQKLQDDMEELAVNIGLFLR